MHRTTAACLVGIGLLAACSASPPPEPEWVPLFDGQSLEGWKASENTGSFRAEDGAITCDGPRSHLFYVGPVEGADFRDFELEAEVLARSGANSGIYFHTAFQEEGWPDQGFEVQVNNSQQEHDGYLEMKKTGSLYGYRNVYKAMGPDDQWFRMRTRVEGRRVRVWVDGTLVVDYREPDELPASWDETFRRLGHGTFALQCHDPQSRVSFRNVRVRTLSDGEVDEGPSPLADETFMKMLELGQANFPLVDLHVHLKGELTLEGALQLSRETGMFFGIAVNVGKGFPVASDEGALQYLEEMEGEPAFVGMQGEGREWVDLVSPEVRARFDYVFTDSMTFTDDRTGQRTRLWIPEEVEVGDPQAFMDMLVSKTVGILENEPIDIYVNPTFLPEVIADDYDRLWTEERMKKVIDAAVRNGVAIEISARYRLPSERFLRMAQEAGAKFTFGTNNAGADDLGDWSYPLEMQRELELRRQDMFVPGQP
jgi:hypothetical protein